MGADLTRMEWLSTAELAELALPGMPTDRKNVRLMAERREWRRPEWEGVRWRERQGQGGGTEYHVSVLPRRAQVRLVYREGVKGGVPADAAAADTELWRWFLALPEKKQAEARRRLLVVQAAEALVRGGVKRTYAAMEVARTEGVALSGLYRWWGMLAAVERADRLPHLVPRHCGRPGEAECSPEAWEMFKADYLRPEQPHMKDCYRRVVEAAPGHGWSVPSIATLRRRIEALAPEVVVMARQGVDALKRMYPAQERDRGVFHALEAVNLDGHLWDVFVKWPDGTVARPMMLAVQDLHSGMILAWRVDRTLHQGLVRLAIGDVVENYGIPSACWMDNGRENASKAITGRVENRYRFKVREEDPAGLLPMLGVETHFTSPYSGQSKPIERAFRDFAGSGSKHPLFAGAYTGNTPMAKPENYGKAAVPLEVFLRVAGEEITRLNTQTGRASRVCGGKLSFVQAYAASVAAGAPIKRATVEQRRLWLLQAEALRVNSRDGTVRLAGNRYWSDLLLPYRGMVVTARFDPDALHEPLQIYRPDGGYLGPAECQVAAGFADVGASKRHNGARRRWMKATKDALEAERGMSIAEVAALMPKAEEPEPPPLSRVVRPVFGGTFGAAGGGAAAALARGDPDDDEMSEADRLFLKAAEMQREWRALHVVEDSEGD